MNRRLLVERAGRCLGVVREACLGGAALPISRSRWVVKEAKRDPAGGKFGLDPHFVRHRGMFGAQLVGGRRVVLIEELAGEKPAFDPPFVAVDKTRGIAR